MFCRLLSILFSLYTYPKNKYIPGDLINCKIFFRLNIGLTYSETAEEYLMAASFHTSFNSYIHKFIV